MENFESCMSDLVKELTQGEELAKQLQIHMNGDSSSPQIGQCLLPQILDSLHRSLSLLGKNSSSGGLASPKWPSGSLLSDEPDDLGSKNTADKDRNSKKRGKKGVLRWTTKVEVCPETANEGRLGDGFGWRKYGQKQIHGAKNPRSYYRCTLRYGKGCLARKHVQRCDDDPRIFEIAYKGHHTCQTYPSFSVTDPRKELETTSSTKYPRISPSNFKVQTSLRVVTEDVSKKDTSFRAPSPEYVNPDNSTNFSDYSPDFLSPAASGSNYFNGYGGFIDNLQDSESEFSRIATSMNSPFYDVDFPYGCSRETGPRNSPFFSLFSDDQWENIW